MLKYIKGRKYMNIEWNDKVDITREQWKELFLNKHIMKDFNRDLIMKVYKKHNCMATATEIAKEEGKTPSSYNSAVGYLGKRIAKYLNIEVPRQKIDKTKFNYWNIVFLGARQKNTGHFLWILRPELKEAIDELIQEHNIILKEAEKEIIMLPEEIQADQLQKIIEGAKYKITVNAYERNPKAKKKCIEYYKKLNNGKVICQICGFDFGDFYGQELEGKIHIHHLKPIHEIGKEYEVDPIKDLIPVCPNCHLVIHSKKDGSTVNEVKKMISKEKCIKKEFNKDNN